ncbi:hypothetical protein MMC27_003406 [Xylographa pallens]|nr:hypothetical protein [Xylographa pallens]
MISLARSVANILPTQVNPSGGKGMAPCSATFWTCDYGTCAQDNFTVPAGNLVLRDYQASSLGVAVAASTVTVVPTVIGSSVISVSTATTVAASTVTVVSTVVGSSVLSVSAATAVGSGQSGASQTVPLGTAATPTPNAGGQNVSATCISSSTDKASSSTIIAVGVGIGVPLGIALAALMLMFCREKKRNARLQQSQHSSTKVETLNRYDMRNTMRWEMDGPEKTGRTTVAELRGDVMGCELPGGNL